MSGRDWAFRTPYAWTQEFTDTPGRALERRPLLDRPSERHPILDALMDEALRRMLLTSDGATVKLSARIRDGGGGGSSRPSSGLAGEIENLWEDYSRCRTHRQRLVVIRAAQEAVDRIMYARQADPRLVRGTLEWKQRIAADPRPRRIVAHYFGVSSKTITAARKQFAGVAQVA